MTALPDPVRRWLRLQRELGLDEVFLDEPWAPPAAPPVVPTSAPGTSRPASGNAPTARRTAPPSPPSPGFPRSEPPVAAGNKPVLRPPPEPARPPAPNPPPKRPLPSRLPPVPAFRSPEEVAAHAASCTRCILHGKRRTSILSGGDAKSSWAILTLYGWADDADSGRLLSGTYATAFLDLVRQAGLPAPTILPLLACVPSDPSDTTIQGFTEAVRCRPHWTALLKMSQARAVLVLDHKATQFARGPSVPVQWPAFRGESWTLEGIPAISTHHPARLARSPQIAPEVASDLARLKGFLETLPT